MGVPSLIKHLACSPEGPSLTLRAHISARANDCNPGARCESTQLQSQCSAIQTRGSPRDHWLAILAHMVSFGLLRDPVDKRGWMAPEERQPRCFSSLHTWEQGRSNKPRRVQDNQAGNHLSSGSPALPCLRLGGYHGSPKLGTELVSFLFL